MPLDIISTAIFDGPEAIPGWHKLKIYVPAVTAVALTKWYFGGASNKWKRDLHGRVFIITGGTSGLGAAVARDLAQRGAQLVLLCRSTDDPFTVDFIDDLREATNNFMIYAEPCELLLLHSVRKFATKWLDNQPPRRLDGVVCCAAECLPAGKKRQVSVDGAELQLAVNYLSHFHLLTLLKPALHVQPADRDVRVVLATCASQALADVVPDDVLWEKRPYPTRLPWRVYGLSKLLLGLFARLFQRKVNDYQRPDKAPCNIRVSVANPGIMRTPSTRRFLSVGLLWGLLVYLVLMPVWFVFFKSPYQGAQSLIFAILAPVLGAQDGGNIIQECGIVTKARKEYYDHELQDELYEATVAAIDVLEKRSAAERNKANPKKEKTDIREKPQTELELEDKLRTMRESMGLPMGVPEVSDKSSTKKRKGKSRKS